MNLSEKYLLCFSHSTRDARQMALGEFIRVNSNEPERDAIMLLYLAGAESSGFIDITHPDPGEWKLTEKGKQQCVRIVNGVTA